MVNSVNAFPSKLLHTQAVFKKKYREEAELKLENGIFRGDNWRMWGQVRGSEIPALKYLIFHN